MCGAFWRHRTDRARWQQDRYRRADLWHGRSRSDRPARICPTRVPRRSIAR